MARDKLYEMLNIENNADCRLRPVIAVDIAPKGSEKFNSLKEISEHILIIGSKQTHSYQAWVKKMPANYHLNIFPNNFFLFF